MTKDKTLRMESTHAQIKATGNKTNAQMTMKLALYRPGTFCFAREHRVKLKNHIPGVHVHQAVNLPGGVDNGWHTVASPLSIGGTSSRTWSTEQAFGSTGTRGGGNVGLKGIIKFFFCRFGAFTGHVIVPEYSSKQPTRYRISLICATACFSQRVTIVETLTSTVSLCTQIREP